MFGEDHWLRNRECQFYCLELTTDLGGSANKIPQIIFLQFPFQIFPTNLLEMLMQLVPTKKGKTLLQLKDNFVKCSIKNAFL